ncbi:DNA polymerase IV [bacterium]|nr:DNA polymerase IV [candidate division CSSED10-310 bacterium]
MNGKKAFGDQFAGAIRKIMHVDMDAFFVSVELLKRPDLRGKPVIVGGKSARGVVSTCSYEAREFGVHSAMPSIQAMRLCPHAIWLSGDHVSYGYYSQRVFEIMRRYSPEVYPLSIDEGRIDLTGSEALFGPAARIADRILVEIRDELGLPASAGLANSGTTAKIASEYAKPRGLAIVMPGRERDFLAPLPVEKIPGVGKKSLPHFHRLGIVTIGDLAAYPEDQLHHQFGKWAVSLISIASGVSRSVVPHIPVSPSRSNECTFTSDLHDRDAIRLETRKLVEKLGFRLRRSGLRAAVLSIKIRDGRFRTITRSRRLSNPTNRDHHLFQVAESLVMANLPASAGVRLLGVAAQQLESGEMQRSLFDQESNSNHPTGEFYHAVDVIKERFGHHAATFGAPARNRIRVAS